MVVVPLSVLAPFVVLPDVEADALLPDALFDALFDVAPEALLDESLVDPEPLAVDVESPAELPPPPPQAPRPASIRAIHSKDDALCTFTPGHIAAQRLLDY